MLKEMESQIADLRASPRARRALEERVWRHLSKRSRRPNRRDHRRMNASDDGSVGINDSAGSLGYNDTAEIGRPGDISDNGTGWHERPAGGTSSMQRRDFGPVHGGKGLQGRSATGKLGELASLSERAAAQTLRTQEVQRRKR